jgi:hypothetical protein
MRAGLRPGGWKPLGWKPLGWKEREIFSARVVQGYAWNQEIVRARNSVRSVRQSLRRMIEEDPEPAVRSNLMARMAAANAECEDALVEIERIAQTRTQKF